MILLCPGRDFQSVTESPTAPRGLLEATPNPILWHLVGRSPAFSLSHVLSFPWTELNLLHCSQTFPYLLLHTDLSFLLFPLPTQPAGPGVSLFSDTIVHILAGPAQMVSVLEAFPDTPRPLSQSPVKTTCSEPRRVPVLSAGRMLSHVCMPAPHGWARACCPSCLYWHLWSPGAGSMCGHPVIDAE